MIDIYFNTDFINSLHKKLPNTILNMEIEYPDKVRGHVRYDSNKLSAVYMFVKLNNVDEYKYWSRGILKFEYDGEFEFTQIYLNNKKDFHEYRYDKDLNLNAKYRFYPNNKHICTQTEKDGKSVDIKYYIKKGNFESYLTELENMDIIINDETKNKYNMDRSFIKENTDILYLTF